MLSVELVGNYAIRIHWSDGHSTGPVLLGASAQRLPLPRLAEEPLANISLFNNWLGVRP
jgi:hypothetical protein